MTRLVPLYITTKYITQSGIARSGNQRPFRVYPRHASPFPASRSWRHRCVPSLLENYLRTTAEQVQKHGRTNPERTTTPKTDKPRSISTAWRKETSVLEAQPTTPPCSLSFWQHYKSVLELLNLIPDRLHPTLAVIDAQRVHRQRLL